MRNRRGATLAAACFAVAALLHPPESGPLAGRPAGTGTEAAEQAVSLFAAQHRIVDGDILVSRDFSAGPDRAVPESAYAVNLWPLGVVPYVFDSSVAANDANCTGGSCQQLMLDAMAVWESAARVDFRPRTAGDTDYLYIRNAGGNASAIGVQGGPQFVDIFRWNSPYTIVHELGHALGYWHEQSRIDRDAFVRVNCENTTLGCCQQEPCDINFRVEDAALNYGPYDFDSVMHYGQCFFSTCDIRVCPFPVTPECVTLTVLPPNDFIPGSGTCDTGASLCDSGPLVGRPCLQDADCQKWQNAIGQRDHLSHFDRLTMSFLYPEPGWVFVDQAASGQQSGSFFKPYRTFADGMAATPANGTLWLQPGSYAAVGTHDRPVTIRAPLGGVSLGN